MGQAKSREKALEKLLASPDLVERPPSDGKGLRFRFPEPPRCGNDVLAVDSVTHGYGDVTLFEDVSFDLRRRDRVAILGANGAGKSTLLRVVSGKEDAREGDASFGSANVRAQYFAQNQADAMDLTKTVMRTIEDASAEGAERSYNELRALLGQFLFKGDDVQKKLESLSGGEKARVALCAMMLSPSNVLFLDEPTNHLDIPAKEMLEDALRHFDGTVVVVSHDRYFVSQVANTIFNIEDQIAPLGWGLCLVHGEQGRPAGASRGTVHQGLAVHQEGAVCGLGCRRGAEQGGHEEVRRGAPRRLGAQGQGREEREAHGVVLGGD